MFDEFDDELVMRELIIDDGKAQDDLMSHLLTILPKLRRKPLQ